MKRPGYREAVEWLAHYDDCYWLADAEPIPSVSACMVADLFDVEHSRLFADLRMTLKKYSPHHKAVRSAENRA